MTLDRQDLTRIRKPVLIITVLAWVLLVANSSAARTQPHCLVMASGTTSLQAFVHMLFTMNPPTTLAIDWFLMLVAMMAPVVIPPIRHIYRRTFANRRSRSILFFLAGYTAVWMASGILLVALELILRFSAPESYLPASAGLLIALIWQCSPFKQRCLNRCHNHRELAAFGSAADLDALRFGLAHGLWCAGSCWLWMLLPMLLPQAHLFAMFAVTLLIISERLEQPCPPRWRPRGLGRVIRMSVAQAGILLHTTGNVAESQQ
jgi:predicted metal-binding membrane protein